MTESGLFILQDQLRHEEGVRRVVYDDASGASIGPGSVLRGHPTVGVGRALDVNPLSDAAIDFLLQEDITAVIHDLNAHLPWWVTMDEVRQRVLCQMRFQLGLHGLLTFANTLALLQDGKYEEAADEMLQSRAASQAPHRWQRLSQRLRTGME